MSLDRREMISRYLDDDLSADEHVEFQKWLMLSSDHKVQFVQTTLLHDRMHGELTAITMAPIKNLHCGHPKSTGPRKRSWKPMTVIGTLLAGLVILVTLWYGAGDTPVSAATELSRLIAAQDTGKDRTYRVDVEETIAPSQDRRRADHSRPPKPPMDGAILHVRRGNQFVLVRQTLDGLPFVTGCNGRVSWAARPDGPVRVSSDLTRFNRDVPGHEHGMPLINLEDGLERLKEAYEIQLLPIEVADDGSSQQGTRLFVAVKRPGFRGPKRVEITYQVTTGHIEQLRFVGMPYGPNLLTLRLTLLEERDLGATFFHHQAHHASDRMIEEE